MEIEEKKKHILIFNRSFWPDIESTGQLITELCGQLIEKYEITAIVGRSYYVKNDTFKQNVFYDRKVFNGIEIIRTKHTIFWKGNLIGRIINWVTYGILSFAISLKIKTDLIIANTDPPFLGLMALLISRFKGTPYIYNCMDIYPDIGLELGRLKEGMVSRLIDYLNKKALKGASFVVCLGKSMKNRLEKKSVSPEAIKIITSWVDVDAIKPIAKERNPFLRRYKIKDKFVIMYSGNLGLSQEFDSVLEVLSCMKMHFPFYLVFIGEGAGKEKLKKQIKLLGLDNALFLSYQPKEQLSFSLSAADLHIIPLRKGMAGTIVPSKVYAVMAVARPYLAVTDRESEPAQLVNKHGCGLWAPPDDSEKINQALKWAFGHQEDLRKMGKIGRKVVEDNFDKDIVIPKWFELIENIL